MAQSPEKKPSLGSNPNLSLLIGAGALIVAGLVKRKASGAAMAAAGGFLAYKGFTENNPKPFTAKARFRINCTTEAAYGLWRDLSALPHFMTHIESVKVLDDKHSLWTAKPPARLAKAASSKTPIAWTAELTEDHPGKRIAWRTTADSAIQTDGFVEFTDDRSAAASSSPPRATSTCLPGLSPAPCTPCSARTRTSSHAKTSATSSRSSKPAKSPP